MLQKTGEYVYREGSIPFNKCFNLFSLSLAGDSGRKIYYTRELHVENCSTAISQAYLRISRKGLPFYDKCFCESNKEILFFFLRF